MKLRVNIGALTRKEYSCIIEVPDGTPENEYGEIARTIYDHTEAEDFTDDLEFWERGECGCVVADAADEVDRQYPHPEDLEEEDAQEPAQQEGAQNVGSHEQ